MLQTQTASPKLLELLKKLMQDDYFNGFDLVGVASLALQIGHRNSVDIDMFGNREIDTDLFEEKLKSFGKVEITQSTKNILISSINDIKVDFVNYKYPLLQETKIIDSIRLASKEDIAAMKLNAILGRGSRKDFIDLYFLLKHFSLRQMFEFFKKKYAEGSEFLVYKSLTYFEDADSQPQPKMFKPFDWELCKQKIIDEVLKL